MAEEAASSSSAPPEEAPLLVNIQIISPSIGVNGPLSFPGLPATTTTVADLKQRVRDALPTLKPVNEHQRMIFNGRLLARENETLQDFFGEQKLRDSDQQQILHLVIRDPVDHHHTPSAAATARGQSPARALPPINPQAAPHIHHHHGQPTPPRFSRPAQVPVSWPGPGPAPAPAPTAFGQPPPPQVIAQQQQQQQQQSMVQWMNQLQREANFRQLRAAMDQGGNPATPVNNLADGRNSPGSIQPGMHGYVREGIGPNGEHWRVTVNGAVVGPSGAAHPVPVGNVNPPAPGGMFTTPEFQNIMRNAEAATQATSMMTNAMHRSASGASLANLNLSGQRGQPIQPPGVTVPRRPGSALSISRTATPDPTRAASHGSNASAANANARSSTTMQPEVYIMSSPTGPRALLINNQTDLYFTPATRYHIPQAAPQYIPPPFPMRPFPFGPLQPAQPQPHLAPPVQQQQAPQQGNIRVNLFQGGQQAQQGPQAAQLVPRAPGAAPPGLAHPHNPEPGAILAAMWPHIWLVIRLGLFIWWFTSSDTSWYRWLTIMFLATAIFLINTGLLNGVANQAFEPLRRHLEGLVPLIGPNADRNRDAAAQPPQEAQNNAVPGDRNAPGAQARNAAPPNPGQVAARLVAQRQHANANWLMDQVRRIERAGVLFLASIAPGVAERHIAALEADERAERERREAEERAATEAAAAAAAAATAEAQTAEEGDSAQTTEGGESGGNEQASDAPPAPPAPPAEQDVLVWT